MDYTDKDDLAKKVYKLAIDEGLYDADIKEMENEEVLKIQEFEKKGSIRPNFSSKLSFSTKRNAKTKRGHNVQCLLIYPGERQPEFMTLMRTENTIRDRTNDREFIVTHGPALTIWNKGRMYDVFAIDAVHGTTVKVNFKPGLSLATLEVDARLLFSLLDETILSRISRIKPDYKTLMSFAVLGAIVGWTIGKLF